MLGGLTQQCCRVQWFKAAMSITSDKVLIHLCQCELGRAKFGLLADKIVDNI